MAEEATADLRRVTILVSDPDPDPDATDSSSDEADLEGKINRRKMTVYEGFIRRTAKSANSPAPEKTHVSDPGTGQSPRVSAPGVRKRKWGKWCAEIRCPFTRRRVWLGTFDSQEAASKAYLSKKLEFEKAKQEINNKKKSVQKGRNYFSVITNPISNKKVFLGRFETAEEASQAYESKKQEFEKSEVCEGESSEVAADGQMSADSCSSNRVGEEEGDEDAEDGMWLGQWVPMPDGREVNFSMKYGIPIIDNYGYLLGDFRKLDDDLWICNSEDDSCQTRHV